MNSTIKLKVQHSVDIEKHKTTKAFAVREGLYVQPMKEVKLEKMIRLSWIPSETKNEEVCEILRLFGEITKPPTDMKFVIRDDAPELTKMLRNIYSNDRQVEMLQTLWARKENRF